VEAYNDIPGDIWPSSNAATLSLTIRQDKCAMTGHGSCFRVETLGDQVLYIDGFV
jgi:hypothetical protein